MAAEEKNLEITDSLPKSKLLTGPLILALVNCIAVLAVTGLLVYTRFIFKRPPITETGEREKLAKVYEKPTLPPTPGLIQIEPFTVNIQPSPPQPKSADSTPRQIQGKLHYATVGFSLELRDLKSQELVEKIQPAFMDHVLSIIGRKAFHELTTVQGRYILRNQLIAVANRLVLGNTPQTLPPVLHLYFTHFIVQ